MKKFSLLILSLINMVVSVLYIALTPVDIVPTHYNITGVADVYSSKWNIIVMPIILVIIGVFYVIYGFIEKKNDNIKANKKYSDKVIFAIFILMLIMLWVFTLVTLNGVDNIGNCVGGIICLILGIMMVYISNLYTKLKQNSYLGIRISATLNSENVWKKTHRIGAYLGVIGGIIVILCGITGIFVQDIAAVLTFTGIIVFIILAVIIPMVYAQVIYNKEKKNEINKK